MSGELMRLMAASLSALVLAGPASAQWSIGAPGTRPGDDKTRYIFFVASNPTPGQESAFNDWYQQVHMGDLVQLEGWTGAQRFRLVLDIGTRPAAKDYRFGYLIAWDQEGRGSPPPRELLTGAQNGGKIRRSPTIDIVTPGAIVNMTYRLVGPKVRRPDGRPPFMPAAADNTHVRPNRYILLEFADPPAGASEGFEAALDRREHEVLALPGWMAAQRMRFTPTEQPKGVTLALMPQYLTMWEIEATSARAANEALAAAEKSGAVHPLARDPVTAASTYWEPISPWIGKEDFNR